MQPHGYILLGSNKGNDTDDDSYNGECNSNVSQNSNANIKVGPILVPRINILQQRLESDIMVYL